MEQPQIKPQRKCCELLVIKAGVKHGRERKCLFLLHVLINAAIQTLVEHVESAQQVQAGCVSQMGQGGQIGIQVDIEDFREDEVVAHNVHWITDFCRTFQLEMLPTLFGQIFKVRDATIFEQDSSVKV